jgi:hypothetical protein
MPAPQGLADATARKDRGVDPERCHAVPGPGPGACARAEKDHSPGLTLGRPAA